MHDVGPLARPLPVTEEDTPPTTRASYRVSPRARHLPTALVCSGPQEDWVPKRGSYHSTTATSVCGSMARQPSGRLPKRLMDGKLVGRKIQARDARSRTGWIISMTTSKRSEPQTGAVAQGGVAGSGNVYDLRAQGRSGGQPTTCDQTRLFLC